MITKVVKRKISECWNHRCAVCDRNDILEFHHLIPLSEGGSDDYDNIILLCASCHATVHGRKFNPNKPNSYFANEIGTRETKEKLNLSQKTHLTESSLYKRYKREHNIDRFYNNVDLVNSKRRTTNV